MPEAKREPEKRRCIRYWINASQVWPVDARRITIASPNISKGWPLLSMLHTTQKMKFHRDCYAKRLFSGLGRKLMRSVWKWGPAYQTSLTSIPVYQSCKNTMMPNTEFPWLWSWLWVSKHIDFKEMTRPYILRKLWDPLLIREQIALRGWFRRESAHSAAAH